MWRSFFILLVSTVIGSSCSGPKQTSQPFSESGYTTSFPQRDMSGDLQYLFHSVKRITSTAFYNTYILAPTPSIYDRNISQSRLEKLAVRQTYTNHSSAGTALVLSTSESRVLLLTCAHVITFPDTVVQFYPAERSGQLRPLKFVAFKDRQTNLLIDNESLGYFDVIAVDQKKDLALLGLYTQVQQVGKVTPMDFPAGNAKNLKMGSFTYTLGYPKGYPMITHAIVGDVMRSSYGAFLIDASFNRGFSGGVVMALKGSRQHLEWVGIANSSSATTEYKLKPDERDIKDENLNDLYDGPIILRQQNSIDYGITKVIPINLVQEFIRDNQKVIRERGYVIPGQFLH